MTTIAFRDGILAADTLVTIGTVRGGKSIKIGRTADGFRWGVTGSMQAIQSYRKWAEARQGDPPKFEHTTFILVDPDGNVTDWYGEGWCEVDALFSAWGSGDELATGAMAAGASAEQAIEIAIRFNTESGGEITVLPALDALKYPVRVA